MAQGIALPAERQSRFWLYAPFTLLALVALAWSAAWFVIRGRVTEGLDGFLAAEAAAGRSWACANRTIGGFPFRIEVACASLSVRDGDATASVGRVLTVAQVYQPRHIIVEVSGPLRASDGRTAIEADWSLLEASLHTAREGIQRASVIVDAPRVRVTGGLPEPLDATSRHAEAHLRRNPARGAEGALDIAASARGLAFKPLDQLLGGAEPADIQIDTTVTQAQPLANGASLDDVERWREAGGRIELLLLSLTKGPRRLEAKGNVGLDEAHRPAGQLALSGAGLDTLIANLAGPRGAMAGALLGQAGRSGNPALTPLPPIRLENGRIALGPITVPGAQVPALY